MPEKNTVEIILIPHSSDILRESYLTSMLDVSEGDLYTKVISGGSRNFGTGKCSPSAAKFLLSGDC